MPVPDPVNPSVQPSMSFSSSSPTLVASVSLYGTPNTVPDVSVVVAPLPSLAPVEENIPALQVQNAGRGSPTDMKAIFPDSPNMANLTDIFAVPANMAHSLAHQAVNDIAQIKNCLNSGLTLSNFEKCEKEGIDIFNKHLSYLTKNAFQTTTLSISASSSASESASPSTSPSVQKSSSGLEIAESDYREVRSFLSDKLSHVKANLPYSLNYEGLSKHFQTTINHLNEGYNKALEYASAAEATHMPSLSLSHSETISLSQSATISFTQSMQATHLVHDDL